MLGFDVAHLECKSWNFRRGEKTGQLGSVTLLYCYLASDSTPKGPRRLNKGESTLLGDPAMVICAQVICSGDLLARPIEGERRTLRARAP